MCDVISFGGECGLPFFLSVLFVLTFDLGMDLGGVALSSGSLRLSLWSLLGYTTRPRVVRGVLDYYIRKQ